MRKKSKKKQIVAMTLALSVLSSSVGMCGAAAATDPPPDADGSNLQVTIVPLANNNNETPAPTAESKTPAQEEETPVEKDQPAASTGDNTDQPTDGEGEGDNNTSSDDKPTIERPEQSETVETLPGTAEDNKDHIKGEDKDDTEDKGDSGEETPGTGDTDTGDTEEKGEEGSGSEETPEQPKETPETPEEKPEETPKEDDTDYSCAYDPDTGHFKVTFNIKEDAEGDQTIELSKVQEVVEKYGEKQFDEWLQTDKGAKWMDDALWYAQYGQSSKKTVDFNGASYTLYVYYDEETGSVAQRVAFNNEPGCTTMFDISLSNGSKHTYVYKDNSLTVATPDVSNTDTTGVTGFDGQELPKEYAGKTNLELKYDKNAESGCMEDLVDAALKKYGDDQYQNQFLDSDGNLTTQITKTNVPAGTEVELINGKYYVKSGDHYYGEFKPSEVQTTKDGKTVLINDKNNISTLAYKKTKNGKKVEKDYYVGPFTHSSDALMTSDVRKALKPYMEEKGYTTYDDYILDYYRKADGSKYDSVSELLKNDSNALRELSRSGKSMPDNPSTGNNTVKMDPSTLYDNFYKNVLSFKVGNQDTVDSEAGGNVDHNHSHGQWAADGTQETIGDYMAGKLNETPGAWDKANAYFNTLLASGLTEDEATWAAFAMATNIDFQNAGNDYQNTAWNWYASMVLHQADGTLDLTKTDKKTGEIIGDDEGEGQTSFYLWKYETDKKTGEKNPMYCTYVEPTYTTNEDGEQVLEKDGFYCWVKYDPSKDKLTYTVTTTNGKLNIDYALLENVVYYLQEAIAPDGYDIDPEIYIICDEESYKELEGTEVTNPATGATSKVTADSWLGSILGGKTLSINFVNTATVPDPEPTPDPDPVPPVDPDIPVDPEKPDTPPVQDETPDETPVTPENPQNPAVQDATPDAAALPQTGTTGWMAGVLASLGSLLLACGWFFTRKQYSPKH